MEGRPPLLRGLGIRDAFLSVVCRLSFATLCRNGIFGKSFDPERRADPRNVVRSNSTPGTDTIRNRRVPLRSRTPFKNKSTEDANGPNNPLYCTSACRRHALVYVSRGTVTGPILSVRLGSRFSPRWRSAARYHQYRVCSLLGNERLSVHGCEEPAGQCSRSSCKKDLIDTY